jgi:hypothetical protein
MAESIHAERRRRRAEHYGLTQEAAEAPLSMQNTKAELLAAAEAAGVEADESMTKAEILKALEAE